MTDVVRLPTPEAVWDALRGLFRTPEFQDALDDPNSFVAGIARRFARRPRAFCEMTEPDLEHGHFYSWMGVVSHRAYENAYVHDLYYLHEIAHLATMPYRRGLDFWSWYLKMHDNEVYAALTSEVAVYFCMRNEGRPIRDKTFPFEIWADRFLDDPRFAAPFPSHGVWDALAEVVARRKTVCQGFGVSPDDPVEVQVSRYARQNFEWAEIWRDHYEIVEASMVRLGVEAEHEAFGPEHALDTHLATLARHAEGGVPFRPLAERFGSIFRQNNEAFGNLTTGAEPSAAGSPQPLSPAP